MIAASAAGREVRHNPEVGEEQLCPRCDEWWPADPEFFYVHRGRTVLTCKACCAERGRRARLALAAQPGGSA